jgi:hypothetical protein
MYARDPAMRLYGLRTDARFANGMQLSKCKDDL